MYYSKKCVLDPILAAKCPNNNNNNANRFCVMPLDCTKTKCACNVPHAIQSMSSVFTEPSYQIDVDIVCSSLQQLVRSSVSKLPVDNGIDLTDSNIQLAGLHGLASSRITL